MPKNTCLKNTLPALLCRPMYEILLHGFVMGRTTLVPAFQISTAVVDFMNMLDIEPDEWNIRTAIQYIYNYYGCEKEVTKTNITKIIKEWEQRRQ